MEQCNKKKNHEIKVGKNTIVNNNRNDNLSHFSSEWPSEKNIVALQNNVWEMDPSSWCHGERDNKNKFAKRHM